MSEHLNNPIPHRKWVLTTSQDMSDCAEEMMTTYGMYTASTTWHQNPQEDSIPIDGVILRQLRVTRDANDKQGIYAKLGHVVVLIDVINLLKVYSPDEYDAEMGGAQ